nr:P,N-U8 [Pinctada fucata]
MLNKVLYCMLRRPMEYYVKNLPRNNVTSFDVIDSVSSILRSTRVSYDACVRRVGNIAAMLLKKYGCNVIVITLFSISSVSATIYKFRYKHIHDKVLKNDL